MRLIRFKSLVWTLMPMLALITSAPHGRGQNLLAWWKLDETPRWYVRECAD